MTSHHFVCYARNLVITWADRDVLSFPQLLIQLHILFKHLPISPHFNIATNHFCIYVMYHQSILLNTRTQGVIVYTYVILVTYKLILSREILN